jgi:hypothetical protein
MNGTLLDRSEFPDSFGGVDELEAFMARPSRELVDDLATVSGDILVLGAGGKMGPTLTKLARNAAPTKRIVAVARFSKKGLREHLESHGIEAVVCDLLDRNDLARLPRLGNVIFMVGRKFGASEDEPLTWAINVMIPGIGRGNLRPLTHRCVLDWVCLSVR